LAISAVLGSENRMNTTISSPASRMLRSKLARSTGIAGAMTAVSSAAMKTPVSSTGIRRRGAAPSWAGAVDMGGRGGARSCGPARF